MESTLIPLLLLFLIFVAFSPALLSLFSSVLHKKLFSFFVILTTLKPVSFVVVPYFFDHKIFSGSMVYYLLLLISYYFLIFLLYMFLIAVFRRKSEINHFSFFSGKNTQGYFILLFALFLFLILVVNSQGVFLLDPRKGYQHHRSGVGFVWVFYILFIGIAFYFFCIQKKITTKKISLFVVLYYLTGSKQLILDLFFKVFFIFLWMGKKINKPLMIATIVFLVLLMLKLFDQFGASSSFFSRVDQYFSFMSLAQLVFDDYLDGDLEFQQGSIFLSSFWGYVPRVIYPDKPFAYGSVSLLEMYFPGMAATGHTPSFGMLTHVFVDFGWFAPFLAILLDLNLLVKIFSLVVVSTNTDLPRFIRVGCIAYILIPGFGFHLPIFVTLFFAYLLIPKLK